MQQLKAEIVDLKKDLYELVYAKHIYSPHEDGDDSQEDLDAFVNRAHEAAAAVCGAVPTTAKTTDTAEPAFQEVQQLKAQVVELKVEIEKVNDEIHYVLNVMRVHTRRYDEPEDDDEAWYDWYEDDEEEATTATAGGA